MMATSGVTGAGVYSISRLGRGIGPGASWVGLGQVGESCDQGLNKRRGRTSVNDPGLCPAMDEGVVSAMHLDGRLRSSVRRLVCAAVMATSVLASGLALAADEPFNHKWKTIDDETGEAKSIVTIVQVGTKLYGRVEQVLTNPDATCDKCDGDRAGKRVQGMTILWGLEKDGDEWSGGSIFDPGNGKTYRCKIWMGEDGRSLKVRGYLGPFFRTQTWYLAD